MAMRVGQQISVCSALHRVQFAATVIAVTEGGAIITVGEDPPCDTGNVLHLEIPGQYRAMAVLSTIERGPCPLLTLTGLAWIGARPRAERLPRAYRVNADFLVDKELKRTVGQTTDLSVSGIRVKLRAAMRPDEAARLLIHVGETRTMEVLARSRRIVQATEQDGKGFDVAFAYERWIRGEEILYEILGAPADHLRAGNSPSIDEEDWFAPSQAA